MGTGQAQTGCGPTHDVLDDTRRALPHRVQPPVWPLAALAEQSLPTFSAVENSVVLRRAADSPLWGVRTPAGQARAQSSSVDKVAALPSAEFGSFQTFLGSTENTHCFGYILRLIESTFLRQQIHVALAGDYAVL